MTVIEETTAINATTTSSSIKLRPAALPNRAFLCAASIVGLLICWHTSLTINCHLMVSSRTSCGEVALARVMPCLIYLESRHIYGLRSLDCYLGPHQWEASNPITKCGDKPHINNPPSLSCRSYPSGTLKANRSRSCWSREYG